MTIEEVKRRAKLYSALAEGKTIQAQNPIGGEWFDVKIETLHSICEEIKYRIKSEPKYRPFETQEECWNEMLKHQPFGWLKERANKKEIVHIGRIFDIHNDIRITLSTNEGRNDNSNYFFNTHTFADGTPFGIKEE